MTMSHITKNDMDEIIGFHFQNGWVAFGKTALIQCLTGEPAILLSRAAIKMMSNADLGEKWTNAANNSVTLFKKSDFKD